MVLLVALSAIDNRNTRLAAENTQMKGRLERLQEKCQQQSAIVYEPLTAERVADAVRRAGFVPKMHWNLVTFMSNGKVFFIDTSRSPQVFVFLQYRVNTGEYDIDLLKHAACIISDSVIMVDIFREVDEQGEIWLRFSVAVINRSYCSFQENLMRYIHLIEHCHQRMNAVYENLLKEKRDAALTISPFSPAEPEKIIMS